MFIMDIPYVPVQDTHIVLAQAAVPGDGGLATVGSTQTPDYILKVCSEMPSMGDPTSAERFVDPIGRLAIYYYQHFKLEPDLSSASSTLLERPKYGKISARTDTGHPMYQYDAEPGYAGEDQVTFMAKYHGKTYKVIVSLEVSAAEAIPTNGPGVCPTPKLIKVKKSVSGSSGYNINFILASYLPNPAFERDCAKARSPSTLRWAS